MQHWHLVSTKPHREQHVAMQLHARGVELLLPLTWTNPINQRASRRRAYFPGLLFVRLDLTARGDSAIRWVPGVCDLIRIDGEPAVVSDAFVSELRRRLRRVRAVFTGSLDHGQASPLERITSGPFAGYEAVFGPNTIGAERTRSLLACAHEEHWRCMRDNHNGHNPSPSDK